MLSQHGGAQNWTFQNFILHLVQSLGSDAELIHEPVGVRARAPLASPKPCRLRGYATCECDRAVQRGDVDGPSRKPLLGQ